MLMSFFSELIYAKVQLLTPFTQNYFNHIDGVVGASMILNFNKNERSKNKMLRFKHR